MIVQLICSARVLITKGVNRLPKARKLAFLSCRIFLIHADKPLWGTIKIANLALMRYYFDRKGTQLSPFASFTLSTASRGKLPSSILFLVNLTVLFFFFFFLKKKFTMSSANVGLLPGFSRRIEITLSWRFKRSAPRLISRGV